MPLCQLKERAILRLTGEGSLDLLQDVLTHDMHQLTAERPLYGALLSPQGKCLFDIFAYLRDGDVMLDADASRLETLVEQLVFYRLRKKVHITRVSDLGVFVAWGEDSAKLALSMPPDPRLADAGSRFLAPARIESAPLALWHARRLPLGLAEADEIGTDIMWLEANGYELHGASFDKGCYLGQENTARMHHRQLVRKRLLPVEFPDERLSVESKIMAGHKVAGSLRGARHGQLQMALLRLEHLEAPLTVAGTAIRVLRPPWLPR